MILVRLLVLHHMLHPLANNYLLQHRLCNPRPLTLGVYAPNISAYALISREAGCVSQMGVSLCATRSSDVTPAVGLSWTGGQRTPVEGILIANRRDDGNKASALAGQATLHLRCLLSECESWTYIVFALTIQYPDIVSGYCMMASK